MKWRPLAFLFLLFSVSARAFAPETELSVFRFYSHKTLNDASVAVYGLKDGLWQPKDMGHLTRNPHGRTVAPEQAQVAKCSSLLVGMEDFQLHAMKGRGYLDQEDVDREMESSHLNDPSQVTVIEMTRPVTRQQIAENPKWLEDHRISVRPSRLPDHFNLKSAAVRVVSGQAMHPDPMFTNPTAAQYEGPDLPGWKSPLPFTRKPRDSSGRTILLTSNPMPWQNNARLWEKYGLKRSEYGYYDLDRTKYPLRWEIGRTAQVEEQYLPTLIQASLSVIEEELRATFQSDPSQAHIFVHAEDPGRIRLYKMYGFTPVPEVCPNENDCVLTCPYVDLIKRAPPGAQSWRLQQIKNALHGRANDEQAKNILAWTHLYYRADLDFLMPRFPQRSPIVFHDMSTNYYSHLQLIGRKFGLDEEENKNFVNLLSSWTNDFMPTQEQYREAIPGDPLRATFYKHNAVRLTNLDSELARANADYLPALITGAAGYLVKRYVEIGVTSDDALAFLRRSEQKIAIQTYDRGIYEQALRLGAQAMTTFRTVEGSLLYSCIFDQNAIARIANSNPERTAESVRALGQGFWFFRRVTQSPLKF